MSCPLLWTPRFLLPVHFCGHPAFIVCPILRTPRFYSLSGFVDTALFTACPLLWTPCFYSLSTFVDTALFTACPVLWTPRFYCLSTFVDTSHTRQRKIPVYWNFYSVSLGTILSCFNSRVKWYLTLVLFAALKQVCQLVTYTSTCCYTLSSRVKWYLT